MKKTIYEDQIVAGVVQQGIHDKEILLQQTVEQIEGFAKQATASADKALADACDCVNRVRDFVSDPTKILGNITTKHGEIAEHIQVEIGNGQRIMDGLSPNASLDVGRTAPEDYLIDGIKVQSKFINSPKKTIEAIIEHSQKYPFFTQENGYYHCPKDYYDDLIKIAKGENVDGLKDNTIRIIREKIQQIESETGKSFAEVVRPGISRYDEVQLGRVGQTLDKHEEEFVQQRIEQQKTINTEKEQKLNQAQHITDPSWAEAAKYSAISAAITGLSAATLRIYSKIHNGKKIGDFTIQDWKEVGYDFAANGAKGGISGAAIYGLTKIGKLSAPFAGAITSSTMGTASLFYAYKQGSISKTDLSDSICALNVEAGLAAVGAALGQVAIPIPALGAIVGSAITKSAIMVTKYVIGEKEKELEKQLLSIYNEAISKLDDKCQQILKIISEYYETLGILINAALSENPSERLEGSVVLCQFLNTPPEVKRIEDIDRYILK